MLYPMNEQFGIPDLLVKQIEVLAQNVKDNRIDALIGFIGGERLGKSTLQARVAVCFAYYLGCDVQIKRDVHYDQTKYIDDCLQVTFPDNNGELMPKKGGQHFIKIYDEPVLGMNARKWASDGNTILNQMLATIGYKYMVLLASIPNFFMFDNTVREHRVIAVFQVYAKIGKGGWVKKGYFRMYTGKMVRKIYKDRETREIIYPKTRFTGMRFESMEGTDFWNEYEKYSPVAKRIATQSLLDANKALQEGKLARTKKARAVDEIMAVEND